jgi:hypothetical protein
MIDDAQDRDALIAKMNKLDLRPFWRPAISHHLHKYPDSPPEDAPAKGARTRDGTPLPDEDESVTEDAWNPKARDPGVDDNGDDGWEVDAEGWTIGRKTQNTVYSACVALSTRLDLLDG